MESHGQYLMTSTCAPRLRAGNGFKIWHYSSTLFHETVVQNTRATSGSATPSVENGQRELIAAPSVDELWEVSWQPSPPGTHPTSFPIVARPIAGGVESKTPTASKQAYRPPGARNRPADAPPGSVASNGVYKSSNKTPVGISPKAPPPGAADNAAGGGELSKSAIKNKKRKEAKKMAEKSPAVSNSNTSAPPPSGVGGGLDKEIRKLQKKLDDIAKLKAKKAAGENLEINQAQKLDKEAELVAEMKKLKA